MRPAARGRPASNAGGSSASLGRATSAPGGVVNTAWHRSHGRGDGSRMPPPRMPTGCFNGTGYLCTDSTSTGPVRPRGGGRLGLRSSAAPERTRTTGRMRPSRRCRVASGGWLVPSGVSLRAWDRQRRLLLRNIESSCLRRTRPR